MFVSIKNHGFSLNTNPAPIVANDLPTALEMINSYKESIKNSSSFTLNESQKLFSHIVPKKKIDTIGDYNLSSDRYKEVKHSIDQKWPMVELGKLTKVFTDGDWIESKDQSPKGIRLVQTGNVGIGEFLDRGEKSRFISEDTFKRLNCTEIMEGDILISRLPDPVGRACIVPHTSTRMITAVDCTIIRFDITKIIPKFFLYYTKSEKYFSSVTQYLTGASRRRISRSNLSKIEILLPPLGMQKEIVEEIEVKANAIDHAKAIIENLERERRYFGQSLRKLGCKSVNMGEIFKKVNEQINPQSEVGKTVYVGLENIESNSGNLVGEVNAEMKSIKSTKTVFKKGDILYGKLRPNLNKVWFSDREGICSTDILVLRSKSDNINSELYSLILRNNEFNAEVLKGLKGSQLPRIGFDYFASLKIPSLSSEIQEKLLGEMKKEQEIINANKQLIEIYEKKIVEVLNEI